MAIKPNQIEIEFLQTDKDKLDSVEEGAQVNPPIASQAVAEAGIDNYQYMTALKVKQAINTFASSAGETNVGANVGTGEGSIYAGKSAVTLQFKKLKAGTNVTISETSTEITINATGTGGGAVDSVNSQTGVVVLDADDIDDSATTNKFTSAADISKLAGIASGAEVNPDVVSQVEAEAGTATVERTWTAQRVKQAILALAPSATSLTVKDEGTNVDTAVTSINFIGSGVTATQVSPGVISVTISAGGSGQETQYLSFDSGRVRVLATGSTADLAAITATKLFDVSAVSRLSLNRPSTVQFHSIMATFTSSETSGRTEIRIEVPEPNSATQLSESIRPIAYRLNAISNVAATGGTISLDTGVIILAHTGYTSGAEQRMIVQF